MAAAASNSIRRSSACLADLRLDDPELRRQAIKSLSAEKAFLSSFRLNKAYKQPCRKWQKISFGLGYSWIPQDKDTASFDMSRPAQDLSVEGLGNDIHVATMSLSDIARKCKEAEAKQMLQASYFQNSSNMDADDKDDLVLLSSDDEMLCLSPPVQLPVKAEIKTELKEETFDEDDSDNEALVAPGSMPTTETPASLPKGSGGSNLTTPDKSSNRQTPPAMETPCSKRSRPAASSADKIMILAESLSEVPGELRRLAKAGAGNVEVVHR